MLKSSVSNLWINIKHVQSSMMEKHIKNKMISSNTDILWINQTDKRAARHKHIGYDKAESTIAPVDCEVYKELEGSLGSFLKESEHRPSVTT